VAEQDGSHDAYTKPGYQWENGSVKNFSGKSGDRLAVGLGNLIYIEESGGFA